MAQALSLCGMVDTVYSIQYTVHSTHFWCEAEFLSSSEKLNACRTVGLMITVFFCKQAVAGLHILPRIPWLPVYILAIKI